MELKEAKIIAEKYLSILKPFCERIEIAGSIRREQPFPNDIELVCIRKGRELFNFVEAVDQWKKVKGKPSGKYTQRSLHEGTKGLIAGLILKHLS
jgi:DNA polymerase/3'-5' exonuclease PolX